ncbi:MAG: hypothetical protein P0Y53_13120 [Candidatus Pseudobacter hemicellulosilyticus]|uniref:Collagen triple helix repeat protein n=1 Tax=Candidatus Pseudobacter hemicellulosilyticus TaxID=3121375 RepID=A0AAJ6BFU8_9BACT|nr:MAG: hypothetical protein P0Y53_13120 [Pseudobacter sp.]
MKQWMATTCYGLLLVFLSACSRQGPMGPEGPQGPDGEDAAGGAGGSNLISYNTPAGASFDWEGIDGWGGYDVYALRAQEGHIQLPEAAAAAADAGFSLLYCTSDEGLVYRLPTLVGLDRSEIYEYSMEGQELTIYAKVREGTSVNYIVQVRVVAAPASETHELSLTN